MANDETNTTYFRGKQAAAYLGLGVSTFYRRIQEGVIPAGIKQSRKCAVWRRADLDNYISRCEALATGGAD